MLHEKRPKAFKLFLLALAFAPLSSSALAYQVYVSNERDNTISVIDSDKLEVTRTFNVGARPRGITLTNDGKFILLCASDDDTVQVIEAETGKLAYTLPS